MTASAYDRGDPCQISLEAWISHPDRRAYVEMMLDHYVRQDQQVADALKQGRTAMFLFEGCSDHMDDPVLSILSYYRVSAVCIAIRLDENGQPKMVYFNDSCSTIPDRPMDYTAWSLPGEEHVGPATICDGTYQLYTVRHKGRYEALNVRTSEDDQLVNAVYLAPDGFVPSRASEINIHTRTGNHTISTGMWSAGCPLIGGGSSWEFWKLMDAVYYVNYGSFSMDCFVGTVTIDRQNLRHYLYTLYEDPDAVDFLLTYSRNAQPETYLAGCQAVQIQPAQEMAIDKECCIYSLPVNDTQDARSTSFAVAGEGELIHVTALYTNPKGEQWYLGSKGTVQGFLPAECVRIGN